MEIGKGAGGVKAAGSERTSLELDLREGQPKQTARTGMGTFEGNGLSRSQRRGARERMRASRGRTGKGVLGVRMGAISSGRRADAARRSPEFT